MTITLPARAVEALFRRMSKALDPKRAPLNQPLARIQLDNLGLSVTLTNTFVAVRELVPLRSEVHYGSPAVAYTALDVAVSWLKTALPLIKAQQTIEVGPRQEGNGLVLRVGSTTLALEGVDDYYNERTFQTIDRLLDSEPTPPERVAATDGILCFTGSMMARLLSSIQGVNTDGVEMVAAGDRGEQILLVCYGLPEWRAVLQARKRP